MRYEKKQRKRYEKKQRKRERKGNKVERQRFEVVTASEIYEMGAEKGVPKCTRGKLGSAGCGRDD